MLEGRLNRRTDPWIRLCGVLAVSFVLAALPVSVTPNPVSNAYYGSPSNAQPSYEPSYQAPYEPTYQQPAYPASESYQPSYQPSYEPSYPTPSYQPSYEPSYPTPSYQPSYEPSYPAPSYAEPSYPAPSYQPSYPSYTPPTYKSEYYPEYVSYEAITYRDLNESIHCGVIPAVNSELYKNSGYQPEYGYGKGSSNSLALNTATLPFGKHPWTVLITDDYNNILCEGTIVNARFILTLKSCVESYALHTLRIRFGEWDILNNANEYEVYKNVEARICRKFPVNCVYGYSAPPSYGYGYQPQQQKKEAYTGLILLEAEFEPLYDAYPHVRSVCLPEYYPEYEASYKPAPAYPQQSYQPQAAPAYQQPATYAAAPYVPPQTYAQPTYAYYSECYVAGYYGSPTTKLQNHKRPTASEGYGNQSPSYPQTSSYSNYYESYESKIPKIAKVKQIKCESYSGYKQSAGYGYGQESCEESMCFVGVHGDACVADYGSAIICLVPEKENYESGYSYHENKQQYGSAYPTPSYPSAQPAYQSSASPSYGYQQNSYKKEIKAITAQDKLGRTRAAIVAVVEHPAQCSSAYKPQQYGYQTQEYQSKPIVAIKVTEKVVSFILEKFFEGVEDRSCPTPTTYYQEPAYYEPAPTYETSSYHPTPSYEQPAYQTPSYQPAYPVPSYNKPY